MLIVDLARAGSTAWRWSSACAPRASSEDTRTLGVYSHVDADTKRRAEAAGFDLVVPRSRMAREGARAGRAPRRRVTCAVAALQRLPLVSRCARAADERGVERLVRVDALVEDPEALVPRRPLAQHAGPQLPVGLRAGRERGGDGVDLRGEVAPVEPADLRPSSRATALPGSACASRSRAAARGSSRARAGARSSSVVARHAQDELGVGRGAVVVDAELPDAGRCAQRDALDVPERRRGVDAAGEHRLDRLEADRGRLHARPGRRRRPPRPSRSTASSDGRPVTPGAPAVEVARALDRRLRQHRRQRPLHERHHADEVAALLPRQPEVVDVEDRDVDPAGLEQLQRVGRGAGPADRAADALRLVVAARIAR